MPKSDSGDLSLPESLTETEFATRFRAQLIELVTYRLPGKSREDCEDVVGDILVAAIKNIRAGKFDPEKGRLQSYVFRIALNKIADFIKDEKKRRPVQNDPERAREPGVAEADPLEQEEERERLRKALQELPVKYQEVLYLKFFEERRVREISETIGLPARRVSERIHYGLRLLAKNYQRET